MVHLLATEVNIVAAEEDVDEDEGMVDEVEVVDTLLRMAIGPVLILRE